MNLRSFKPRRSLRHNSRRSAFTIIESLVLLAILLAMTMIVIALARRHFFPPASVEQNPTTESQTADPADPSAAAAQGATSAATE